VIKFFAPLFWIALFAAVAAGIIAYVSDHPPATGLHEDLSSRVHPAYILFFYWWGGLVAALSPMLYIYLWRRTRGTKLENSEGF